MNISDLTLENIIFGIIGLTAFIFLMIFLVSLFIESIKRIQKRFKPDYVKPKQSHQLICPVCGSVGNTQSFTPGSFLIEVVLWLCFLIPGLIYSLWRLSARKKVCAGCGSAQLIPLNSPMGRKIQAELNKGAAQSPSF
jgi:uncharacterized membrane protein YqaE (UPF0057 family)